MELSATQVLKYQAMWEMLPGCHASIWNHPRLQQQTIILGIERMEHKTLRG
jgi:hypothetical protein